MHAGQIDPSRGTSEAGPDCGVRLVALLGRGHDVGAARHAVAEAALPGTAAPSLLPNRPGPVIASDAVHARADIVLSAMPSAESTVRDEATKPRRGMSLPICLP